eukprot:CAMPEP_0184330736 /NCGR_PEP_ID=MMETSP1049-20130417/144841_1 /TAXON_ID=77928 /ORGANISM="Proteomonas sulcata, Strain CCMP704" /LENGTH=82 /DNA_ID=CAMNT_0026653189 /DNA_START=1122 /DNA_END=1370 /DNA_ORIENTATION=+
MSRRFWDWGYSRWNLNLRVLGSQAQCFLSFFLVFLEDLKVLANTEHCAVQGTEVAGQLLLLAAQPLDPGSALVQNLKTFADS